MQGNMSSLLTILSGEPLNLFFPKSFVKVIYEVFNLNMYERERERERDKRAFKKKKRVFKRAHKAFNSR